MMGAGGPETSSPGYMLKAAIIQGPDANWFFKFTGPQETVQADAGQFQALRRFDSGPTRVLA